MKFEVTQELIDKSPKSMCSQCPVASAIRAKIKNQSVMVWADYMYIGSIEYHTPKIVSKFIRDFDVGVKVKPFSFNLNYEPKS